MRVGVALLAGIAGGLIAGTIGEPAASPLIGWDVAAVVFAVWTWLTIWPQTGAATARHAVREDPSRAAADVIILGAAVASLAAVTVVLLHAGKAKGSARLLDIGLAIASVVASWVVVHTVFTLKYARLYYHGVDGGIDFNGEDPPRYSDFAYIAFTIGMTFQVSDTDIQTDDMRRAALRHALLSYLLGAVIIAVTINLISGLTK